MTDLAEDVSKWELDVRLTEYQVSEARVLVKSQNLALMWQKTCYFNTYRCSDFLGLKGHRPGFSDEVNEPKQRCALSNEVAPRNNTVQIHQRNAPSAGKSNHPFNFDTSALSIAEDLIPG